MTAPRGVDRAKHEAGVEAAQQALVEKWPWLRSAWLASCETAPDLEMPVPPFEAAILAYLDAIE